MTQKVREIGGNWVTEKLKRVIWEFILISFNTKMSHDEND